MNAGMWVAVTSECRYVGGSGKCMQVCGWQWQVYAGMWVAVTSEFRYVGGRIDDFHDFYIYVRGEGGKISLFFVAVV